MQLFEKQEPLKVIDSQGCIDAQGRHCSSNYSTLLESKSNDCVREAYCEAARGATKAGDAGARWIASDVLICRDSMALGAGLLSRSPPRFLKEARLNLLASLSREADLPGPFLAGGGGN